ncbi:DnaJ sub C member 13 [Chamberlinius hualienensis]
MKENKDVACFLVTKHSWKGKYKRIFSVGTMGITTYNPSSFEVTNQWPYSDFFSIIPNSKVSGEFSITMRKGKKTDTMRFSSEHRAEILTEALKFRHLFADDSSSKENSLKYVVHKHHWSDTRLPVVLEVSESSLNQREPTTNKLLVAYNYKDMESVIELSNYQGGFVIKHGGFGRLHLFASEKREEIIKRICNNACDCVGVCIRLKKESITFEEFVDTRLGKYSSDENITSLSEFTVQKMCDRHMDPTKRILALTETCLIERDPGTYCIATCRPLSDVFAIIRSRENPQLFSIEYLSGHVRSYLSTDRDSLLASLMDGVRASGNADVHVKMIPTDRGLRLGPLSCPVDEEVESWHLKFLLQPPMGWSFSNVVFRFNSNLPYSGLLHAVTQDGLFAENKERLIQQALNALLDKEGDSSVISGAELESQFQALRRLVASKAGFASFTQLLRFRERLGTKVVKALKRNDDGISYAAIDMLCALMEPMHTDYDLRQEQLNKSSLLSSKTFLEGLLDLFTTHVMRGSGAIVVAAMLDFLTYALCAPYSETTSGEQFDMLLEMVALHGRTLFRLFQHPSMTIVKGTGLIMKAIIEEGTAEIAAKMQELALAEGSLPRHLLSAMFTNSIDSRMLVNRQLSRHLVGLWVTGNSTAMSLLKRILPPGLLMFLESTEKVPVSENDLMHIRDNLKLAQDHSNRNRKNPQWKIIEKHIENVLHHWRTRIGNDKREEKLKERPIILRMRRERIKSEANWPMFYYKFNQDHTKANLIWNFKTREELKETLENEIRMFNMSKDLSGSSTICWNYQECEVLYNCLSDEIKIGDYYLRLLLEDDDKTDENSPIRRPYEFFNDLYHRFLLSPKSAMKCMCLQAMTIVYGRHYADIGSFNDTKYIVAMLEKCVDKLERDRLVLFLSKLILDKKNVKDLLDANGIRILVDLVTLAHMHTTRATVPTQTNVIEASPEMMLHTEKEWYFGNGEKERRGPCSFAELKDYWTEGVINSKTRCWAQGMDGWRPLQAIPQLKWCLMATGNSIMNESDLAVLLLNMLIRICDYYPSRDLDDAVVRPIPKAKRLLYDATCLPHVVQLLLTFDPVLVEKVATLVHMITQDNPFVPQIYLTGVFFFILMYTGSNVVPIGRFLQYTHTKQAFRSEDNQSSDIMSRSILGQILPEAMVRYLENYGAEKFAETFLGEFDTPEVIWNNEMRRMMIQKLAAHVADFTPRLLSNNRALYQYCPIPVIKYPQLENELFCNMFYLRHLCDVQRFPNWPIKDPVIFLKDVLEAWKREVEKKPPLMSVDDAFEVLGLIRAEVDDESIIRKSYFRLAQKYHPDKNKDGREMFEKVNKAYEFLCSRTSRVVEGPDPVNIVLILKAQSILYNRYKEDLQPYKYAGYPMLIKTIEMEASDDKLFSKEAPLLTAATELTYHTVNCSALNAEELRREKGLELLQEAFARCVSVLSRSSKPNDFAVQVCSNILKCFSVAAQFPACRDKIIEMPSLVGDICRVLYYQHLAKLCIVAVECVYSFAVDNLLQMHLLQSGVLWHLLLHLFQYDYTLEESGLEKSEESNKQEVANRLAIMSVDACARLGGYLSGDRVTPENDLVRGALRAMLSPYTANQLKKDTPTEVLKIFNSNTENPYLIWNNGTRAELTDYLQTQQTDHVRTGQSDHSFGSEFVFSLHSRELIIGEIFVRVYNEQPEFAIENPKNFAVDILEYLGSEAQYLHSLMSLSDFATPTSNSPNDRCHNVEMALEALGHLIKNNSGVEIQCIGHFKMLFSILGLEGYVRIQELVLEVIHGVTGNSECVNDIAAMGVLPYILMVSQSLPSERPTILNILYALVSNNKIVKEAYTKGAVIYLLDHFCNSTNGVVREKTAELLAKMISDKLFGPKLRILVNKFLPTLFTDAMLDSPETSVMMFENTFENPELIWNDETRKKVCEEVSELKNDHYRRQQSNPSTLWKLPDGFAVVYANVENEIVVGGVFLRLFVANPGWVLRRPKEFLSELLNTCLDQMNRNPINIEMLDLCTNTVTKLLQAQPVLGDLIPNQGHIPQMLKAAGKGNESVAKSCILIVHQLSNNRLCVQSMAQCDCIRLMKTVMKTRKDMVGLTCETLYLIFEKEIDDFVQQALEADLIPYLLSLLEGGLECVENPASTKAQIVKALKAATRSLQYGDKVNNILEKSKIWADYKLQKHDLFISMSTSSNYLTGTAPSVAGYLTQGPTKVMPDAPPPIDHGYEKESP